VSLFGGETFVHIISIETPKTGAEISFASFFSGGFITAIVVNPLERKLAKRTSVLCGERDLQKSGSTAFEQFSLDSVSEKVGRNLIYSETQILKGIFFVILLLGKKFLISFCM
jgi:hypothetical protein